jgi:hypothetical protein
MQKISLADKLSTFHEHWSPKIIGELNGQHVKLVKFQGEFVGTITTPKTSSSWF